MRGGPIGALRDGDEITVDVDNRVLDVALTDEEIAARLTEYEPPIRENLPVVLKKYAEQVRGAELGAVTH